MMTLALSFYAVLSLAISLISMIALILIFFSCREAASYMKVISIEVHRWEERSLAADGLIKSKLPPDIFSRLSSVDGLDGLTVQSTFRQCDAVSGNGTGEDLPLSRS